MILLLYKLINWYTRHLPFPHRGWKFFYRLLKGLKLDKKLYQKKIAPGLFIYVNAADHVQQQLFWYGCYENPLPPFFENIISPGTVVIDAGANIGYFSLLAAKKATKGTVYSFEPVSATFNHLLNNIKLNQFKNVTPVNKAVSDKNMPGTIFIAGEENAGMSSLLMPENYAGYSENISCITVDEFLQQNASVNPGVIKIDIEGAEYNALNGMKNCLEKFKPLLIIEVIAEHLQRFNTTPQMIYTFLAGYGYKAYTIKNGTALALIHEPEEGYAIVFIPDGYVFPGQIKLL